MHSYVTVQGDTWDIISLRIYGTEKQMSTLIEANPAYRETVFFSANITLQAPEMPVSTPSNLPPWRRSKS